MTRDQRDREEGGALIGVLQTISLELASISAGHPSVASRIKVCRDRMTGVIIGLQVEAVRRLPDG
ncbi:MAG TPA: hypothetical protein VIA06_08865 [Candidatus Dormibacteraeota bacterium]|nr:hypothetical protein [Candidatus Dormibacteraeota bacterium]